MALSQNTIDLIEGYFTSDSSLSLMGAAENQPPGKKKYYFEKVFELDSQKFSDLMDKLYANNPCGSEKSFIHLLLSINLIKNNGRMRANSSGETTALDFYFKQRGPEESHTEIAECIRKSPEIAQIISNELNEEDQREYDRLKNANNENRGNTNRTWRRGSLLPLESQNSPSNWSIDTQLDFATILSGAFEDLYLVIILIVLIGIIATYYVYKEISNAFQDIANRTGDVLLCTRPLSPEAEWEFIKRKITVITRISDRTDTRFNISYLSDNDHAERQITAADDVYRRLDSLNFPTATQGTAFSLIPSDLCIDIDSYLNNNNCLTRHHKMVEARRGYATLAGAVVGLLGSSAVIACIAMGIIAFSLNPQHLVLIAVAVIPLVTLGCAKAGKAIGEECMERKLPNPLENPAVRPAHA